MKFGALLLSFTFAVGGCSEDHSGHDGGTADSGTGGMVDGAVSIDAMTAVDSGTGAPGTPVLVSATLVVHGTMALAWQNPASTCQMVAINRKQDAGAYVVATTLTGQATSAQDMPGHTNGTYCYTITCKLNGMSSAPSNEKCVTQ